MTDDILACSPCQQYTHLSRWNQGFNETQVEVLRLFLEQHQGWEHQISVVDSESVADWDYWSEIDLWPEAQKAVAAFGRALNATGARRPDEAAADRVQRFYQNVKDEEDNDP